MKNENCVLFKGRKDGLTVALDESADFGDIKDALRHRLTNARRFFESAEVSVIFRGRDLSDAEEDELKSIINEMSGININYLGKVTPAKKVSEMELRAAARREEAPRETSPDPADQLSHMSVEYPTKFVTGSMRSGQSVRYKGSVVVIGDVNPGAEILAEGNIIVLGTLKGLAHAGCRGNHNSFISALLLKSPRLRIAEFIITMPEPEEKRASLTARRRRETANPVYAYAKDGQIYISELV